MELTLTKNAGAFLSGYSGRWQNDVYTKREKGFLNEHHSKTV